MTQFLLIAIATFASEDLTCIATGALIASGKIAFVPGVLACLTGIYAGDLLLYFAGRLIGRRVLRRFVSPEKLDRASQWLVERGATMVVLSRFTPGLRLPTYLAAGLLKTRFWTFSFYFLMAAMVWTPLLVGAAALLGTNLPHIGVAGPVMVLVVIQATKRRPSWHTRRRLLGWIRRRGRWEFWPAWLAYIPVLPYVVYLGLKHRCLTLFTAANPGIPSGGFVGESKSAILSHFTCVPVWTIVNEPAAVDDFMRRRDLSYPIVLKPDVGERGSGVVIARCAADVAAYFQSARPKTIAQQYVGGMEFGIFYYRYPGEIRGRIFSITEKHFPAVTGDGSSTIRELVLRDERAVCLADLYLNRLKRAADDVPATGEVVPLAELGSHCRGAIFLNGTTLETEAMRSAVDSIAKDFPGFYFGRFDVRADSMEALQRGEFHILELNGVAAEATHIYDPAVSLAEAYRVLFRQWRIAFEIGASNRDAGHEPMRLVDLLVTVRSNLRREGSPLQQHGDLRFRPGADRRFSLRPRPSRIPRYGASEERLLRLPEDRGRDRARGCAAIRRHAEHRYLLQPLATLPPTRD
jgi:membrane protein DedA with SNARE-associated domain